MICSTDKIDAVVIDALRESGQNMSTAEIAYEVGLTIDAADRSLSRLADRLLARRCFGSGGWEARREQPRV